MKSLKDNYLETDIRGIPFEFSCLVGQDSGFQILLLSAHAASNQKLLTN